MNSRRGSILIVVILIIAIAAVAGAYFLGKQGVSVFPQIQPSPTSSPVEVPTKESDVTANWNTYRNEKYGFEFKYPNAWFIGVSSDGTLLLNDSYFDPKTVVEPDQVVITMDVTTKKALVDSYSKSFISTSTKQLANGVVFKIKDSSGDTTQGQPAKQVLIAQTLKEGILYRFGVSKNDQRAIFDQILSTFKFMNSIDETKIDSKVECGRVGGVWQKWGIALSESCQIPAKDSGKPCTGGLQCSSGNCLAEDLSGAGKCSTYKNVVGCWSYLNNGKHEPIICSD